MENQLEVREYQGVVREQFSRKTLKEVLAYVSNGVSSETKRELADFLGVSIDEVKDIPVSWFRQIPVSEKEFGLGEFEIAEKLASENGYWVEELTEESESGEYFDCGYTVMRYETTEEVKARVLDKDFWKNRKELADEMMKTHKETLLLENFDVDLSELTINNLVLNYNEDGIHSIERSKGMPAIREPVKVLTLR
jgi:hypothetical protein